MIIDISHNLRRLKVKSDRDESIKYFLLQNKYEIDLYNTFSYKLSIENCSTHIMLYTSTLKIYTLEFGTRSFTTLSELHTLLKEIEEHERSK